MAVTTPQFLSPFQLGPDGKPVVVQQDSLSDVVSCVLNILVCPQHTKLGDPQFGVPSLLFQTVPLTVDGLLAGVRRLEPRATVEAVAMADKVAGASTQDITVSVAAQGRQGP